VKCVGLDLGTTKIAGLLLETGDANQPARVLRVVSRDHEAALPAAHPWEHLQDAERLLNLAREALGELGAEAGPADGLCVTGQMHGILYVDAAGNAVSPLATWLDQRAGQPHPAGASFAEVLSARTGYRVPPGYGAATHFYNLGNGLVPRTAAGLCSVMDFVTIRLAGERRPVTDATVAATFGLYDLAKDRLDPAALRKAGLDDLAWSRVVPAGTRIGATPAKTVVFAPVGDNQASFLGSVRDVEHSAQLNVGTGGQISVFARELSLLPVPLEARPFPGGGFLHIGASLCGGKAYALLEEFFRQVCESLGGARPEALLYDRMNELAREGGEERPLEVDTRFQGTRGDSRVTGRIEGITPGNLTPAALVRGFLRGVAGELYGYFREITRAEPSRITAIVGSGNGIRRNPALRAEVARMFALPLLVPRRSEEAALGAALCAAVGLGALPGYARAGELIEYERERGE
jgi:sedoheptulokinase